MSDAPQEGLRLPDEYAEFRNWKPEYQQKVLDRIQAAVARPWRPFYCSDPRCDGLPHGKWAWNHARMDQRPPPWGGNWLTFFLRGGRGSGKTRSGSELTQRATQKYGRIILVGATGHALRETMVEGPSGLLNTAKPGEVPVWEPSKKKLTWPNGCIGLGFSAEEPDRLRGPESGYIWADEPAHWDYVEACWDNMKFGLRIPGAPPKIVATSTPLPTKWMRGQLDDPLTRQARVSTYANLINLAETFKQTILDKYEGTRLGRQELHGELLEDVEGALWAYEMFRWVDEVPQSLKRIVVGVDPAGTTNKRSDETGIIVVGIAYDKRLYVLADYTGKYSPGDWAAKANWAYDHWQADAIVPERNFGEDMVRFTLENSGFTGARILTVRSRRGKEIRAEPIVALYEKGQVLHYRNPNDVGGADLTHLEDEQTTWVPGTGPSPNRIDALVHACTQLRGLDATVTTANPNNAFGRGGASGGRRSA